MFDTRARSRLTKIAQKGIHEFDTCNPTGREGGAEAACATPQQRTRAAPKQRADRARAAPEPGLEPSAVLAPSSPLCGERGCPPSGAQDCAGAAAERQRLPPETASTRSRSRRSGARACAPGRPSASGRAAHRAARRPTRLQGDGRIVTRTPPMPVVGQAAGCGAPKRRAPMRASSRHASDARTARLSGAYAERRLRGVRKLRGRAAHPSDVRAAHSSGASGAAKRGVGSVHAMRARAQATRSGKGMSPTWPRRCRIPTYGPQQRQPSHPPGVAHQCRR